MLSNPHGSNLLDKSWGSGVCSDLTELSIPAVYSLSGRVSDAFLDSGDEQVEQVGGG